MHRCAVLGTACAFLVGRVTRAFHGPRHLKNRIAEVVDFVPCSSSIAMNGQTDIWRRRRKLPGRCRSTTSLAAESTDEPKESGPRAEEAADPAYTFGLLTDIQHAPIPDGTSFTGNPRYYRHALEAAEHAARHFEEEKVQVAVNLGDAIDGKCTNVERWGGTPRLADDSSEEKKSENEARSLAHVGHDAIDNVVKALSHYKSGRFLHAYGNHELYNFPRTELAEKLSIPFQLEQTNELVGYYGHLLEEPLRGSDTDMKIRFLILDSYDICLLDRCSATSGKHKAAHKILLENNPNYPRNVNSPENLEGVPRRFVGFGGAVDLPQLEWLEDSLRQARDSGERVIICSHQPIHPGSTFPTCLIWNYEDVLSLIRRYSDVVIASFSGHAHKGGYARDEESGVHFRCFDAMLESPPPIRTYAIVDVFDDRMVVRGEGRCKSDVYDFDHLNFLPEEEQICA